MYTTREVKQTQAHAIDVLMVSEMIRFMDLPERVSKATDDRVRLIPHLTSSIALHDIEPVWSSILLATNQGESPTYIAKLCIYSAPYTADDLNQSGETPILYLDVTNKSDSVDYMCALRDYIKGWIDGICIGR